MPKAGMARKSSAPSRSAAVMSSTPIDRIVGAFLDSSPTSRAPRSQRIQRTMYHYLIGQAFH